MSGGAVAQPSTATRDRILAAAILRFSRQSYEETGLRDIAADVGVDVAYVHRCFGSKERLFAQALKFAVQSRRILEDLGANPAQALARQALCGRGARSADEVRPLDIFVRSLSSPKAAAVVRTSIIDDLILPLGERLGGIDVERASLATAVLVGVAIFRSVLELPTLAEGAGDELERNVADAIAVLLDERPRP